MGSSQAASLSVIILSVITLSGGVYAAMHKDEGRQYRHHQKILISNQHLHDSMPDAHEAFFQSFDDEEGWNISTSTGGKHSQQRNLAAVPVSHMPVFDPPGGAYPRAMGVALLASQSDDLISYTLKLVNDTFNPNGTTYIVPSGYIVSIEQTGILKAFTVGRNGSSSSNSATITATYTIPFRQFGAAYLVPHHHGLPGYSGKVVRVNLRTDLLSYVRVHGVFPDFADYYSPRGQAPYTAGMLRVNDLSKINAGLAGFQNGFSGRCHGKDYGFLAPFFDGSSFSGKVVRIRDRPFLNVSSGVACTTASGSTSSHCAVRYIDLTLKDPELAGFSGGFIKDCYAYFVPYFNGYAFASKVVKVHAVNFTLGNVTVLDLQHTDPELAGWYGGFAHGNYGYLVPFRNVIGPVGGVNSHLTCDGFKGNQVNSQAIGGGHLQPHMFGKFVRFDFSNFTSHDLVDVLDLSAHDLDIRGFSGAILIGNQAILVPFRNHEIGDGDDGYASKIVKVDLSDFSSVEVLDLAHINPALRGFTGGFAWGKYAVLVPHANGNVTNWEKRREHGLVVRIDVNDFTVHGTKYLDLSTVYRQQIPSYPLPHLRGFVQGFVSGRHGYFVPYFNGARSGVLVRVDMSDFDRLADLQAAGNSTDAYGGRDGVQAVDLALYDPQLVGFSGGFTIPETGWAIADS